MFYSLAHYDMASTPAPGKVRVHRINTELIAFVSTGEEGERGPLEVEIGFSGGAVLKLVVEQQNWNQFWSIVDPNRRS